MNWQHLRTFLWLRWRLTINVARRGGKLNRIVTLIVLVAAMALVLPLGLAAFIAGLLLAPHVSPIELMFIWDGLVLGFLFFWAIGLITELQRTELLSLDRFLHLPVSVQGVFAINFVSSLLRLSMLVFAPVMFGFATALVFAAGPLFLLALPLTAALLLMVAAVSYQFQGWLASLMTNPRRRRTVTVLSVIGFVALCQLPQLINFVQPWRPPREQAEAQSQELSALDRALQTAEITPEEHTRRYRVVREHYRAAHEEHLRQAGQYWKHVAIRLNQVLPIGWLPTGVRALAQQNVQPALLGLTGMMLLATGSLWRAHRTTLKLYQGKFTNQSRAVREAAPQRASRRETMLLWRLPGLSEPASAVALCGFRSLVRSPEGKMMLLTPLLMGGVFGGILLTKVEEFPLPARPLLALGGMLLALFGLMQVMANQFGFDRDGFRVFVLSAVDRRQILLGKNMAFAPFAFGFVALILAVIQIASPLNACQLLAAPLQFTAMFVLFCLLANLFSIYTPVYTSPGSLKAKPPNLLTVLVQFVGFSLLFPLTVVPAVTPVAVEALVNWDGRLPGSLINLVMSLLLCAVAVWLYQVALAWQAKALETREQKILDTVTNRAA